MGRMAVLVVFDEADPQPIYLTARDADGYAATRIDNTDDVVFLQVLQLARGMIRLASRGDQVSTIPAELASWARGLVELVDAP
jgi:hypothetical protein